MKKILVVAAAMLAMAACAPPAAAEENGPALELLSPERFLALDTFQEPNGALPQRAVLRWYGLEKYELIVSETGAKLRPIEKRDPGEQPMSHDAVFLGHAPRPPLRL